MASEWIKFEKATSDKPEVWAIACALNVDPDAVVGKLLRVWAWFDEQTENGNAPSVTKMLLDRKVGVTGFCDAVISAGWMQEKDNAITLPNFERHNGETAKKRALGKNRTEKHRSNADVTPQPLQEGKTGNAPSVTDALPEEEKKRKERDIKDMAQSSGDESANHSPPPNKPEGEKHRAKGVTKARMREDFPDLTDQTINDWITARKNKKATTLTETAWKGVVREIRKTTLTGEQAIQLAAEKGWRGFEAEWYWNSISARASPQSPAPGSSKNAQAVQAWLESGNDERH